MSVREVKFELEKKKSEFELAQQLNEPPAVLKEIYCRLKELQYELVQAEVKQRNRRDMDMA